PPDRYGSWVRPLRLVKFDLALAREGVEIEFHDDDRVEALITRLAERQRRRVRVDARRQFERDAARLWDADCQPLPVQRVRSLTGAEGAFADVERRLVETGALLLQDRRDIQVDDQPLALRAPRPGRHAVCARHVGDGGLDVASRRLLADLRL